MVSSLKTGLAKTGSSIAGFCGVIVLGLSMLAAVLFRWATKPTHEIPESEFTKESARTER
jgi:hypothetical protein